MPEDKAVLLRREIDDLISARQYHPAARNLATLWRQETGPAAAAFVVSRYEELRGNTGLLPYRLAILRSFTVETAIPLLRAEAFCSGIDLAVRIGDFNAYAQEILDKESSLYQFAPNVVILAVRTPDIAPDLWYRFSELDSQDVNGAIQRVSSSFQQWMQLFRERSQAALILHNLEEPAFPSQGVLDSQLIFSQRDAILQINCAIRNSAKQNQGIYVLDYDGLVSRHGRLSWHDERKWLTARMPIAADKLVNLAREWLRFVVPLSGKISKALVVDLDNTLWGGIIGEDGMNGIKLGTEYPGAGYQALQRAMIDLSRRGILLAICSKNNLDDAMEALQSHPGMLLRPEDFAAMRISWNDKAQGLREIAEELNIGIDSLAFLDDNPFEREQVRAALPDVSVIDLPNDPLLYATTVRNWPGFERLTLSAEDQKRTLMYAEQRERAQAEHSFQSKEDFYRYLQQEAEIAPVTPATLARVAQLTQKTNQFNLTTRRYTEQQISEIANRPDWQVLSIRARDRFGDHGLVGVAITKDHDDLCEIDSFLLSCRVIGRTVEGALLAHLASDALARGRKRIWGRFLPTKKNAPAQDFYPHHGFALLSENGEGTVWELDLTEKQLTCPDWIKIASPNGGQN
jgi:FkbH-like protein